MMETLPIKKRFRPTITKTESLPPLKKPKKMVHFIEVDEYDQDAVEEQTHHQERQEVTCCTSNCAATSVNVCMGNNAIVTLPVEYYNNEHDRVRVGQCDFTVLIKKAITSSDMDDNQARLSMPRGQLRVHDFVTEQEKEWLNMYDEDGRHIKKKIDVRVIGPNRKPYDLKLSKWIYEDKKKDALKKKKKTTKAASKNKNKDKDKDKDKATIWPFSYMLLGGWKEFKKENLIEEDDIIAVWYFRFPNSTLGLVINKLGKLITNHR